MRRTVRHRATRRGVPRGRLTAHPGVVEVVGCEKKHRSIEPSNKVCLELSVAWINTW